MKNNRKVEGLKKVLKDIGIKLQKIPKTKKAKPFEHCLVNSISFPYEDGRREVIESKTDYFLVTTIFWKFADGESGKDLSKIHKNKYVMTLTEIFKFKKMQKNIMEDIIKIEPYEETH